MATISADIDLNISKLLSALGQATAAAKNAATGINSAFKGIEPVVDVAVDLNAESAKNEADALKNELDIKPVEIPIKADFGKIAEQARQAGKAVSEAFVNPSGKLDTSGLASGFNQMRQAAQATVAEQKNALAALAATGQKGTAEFNQLEAELKQSVQEANRLDNALADVDKEIGSVGDKKIDIGGQLSEGLKGGILGGLIGGGIAGLVQTGLSAIGEGFSKTIELGQEFEQSLAGISAITGVAGKPLEDLGQRARDLAKEFGGDAKTQLDSFQGILSRFGAQLADTPEQLGEVSKNINILAKAGGLDAAGAMDSLTTSMLQFGVDVNNANEVAAESGRFINVLAASAKVGAAEIPQVAEAVKAAGVAAKGANLSFEETNAAIQVLAAGGKVGAEAGTGLRNVLGLLIKQSGEGEKTLSAMGTSTAELGKILTTQGLNAALAKVSEGMGKFSSDAEKAAALSQLFGAENASSAGILIESAKATGDSASKLAEWTKQMTGTKEAVSQAQTNMATFTEGMSRLKSGVEDIGLDLFGAFKDAFSGGGGNFDLGGILNGIQAGLKPVFASIAGNVAIVFEQIKAVVSIVILPFQILFDVVSAVAEAFGGAGTEAIDWAKVVEKVAATIKGFYTSVIDLTTAIREKIKSAIESAKPFIASLVESFRNIIAVISAVADFIGTVFSGIGSVISSAFGGVISIVTSIVEMIQNKFVAAFGILQDAVRGVAAFFADIFNPAIETTSGVISSISGTVSGVFAAAWNKAIAAITPIVKLFTDVRDKINEVGGVTNYLRGVLSGLEGAFNVVVGVIRNFISTLSGGNIIGAIKNLFSDVSNIGNLVGTEFEKGFNKTTSAVKQTTAAATDAQTELAKTGKVAEKSATTSADAYKKLAEQIGALKVSAPTLTSEQLKAQGSSLKDTLAKSFDLKDITQEQLKTLDEQLNAIISPKKEKKDDKKDKSGIELLKEKLALQRKDIQDKRKDIDLNNELALASDGVQKADLERIKQNKAASRFKAAKEELEAAKELFKATQDGDTFTIPVSIKGDGKERQAAVDLLEDINREVKASNFDVIKVGGEIDKEAVLKNIATLSESIKADEKTLKETINVETAFKFPDKETFKTKVQLGLISLSRTEETLKAKFAVATDPDVKEKITKELETITKVREESEKKLTDVLEKVSIQRREAEIASIADDAVRERETKILNLEKQRDKELENEALTATGRLVIEARFQKQIDALRNGKAAFDLEKAALSLQERLQKAFTQTVSEEERKRTEEKKAELDKQADDFDKQLKKGEISYNDYLEKLNDLDRQRAETVKGASVLDNVLGAVNSTLSETLKGIADEQKAAAFAAFSAIKTTEENRVALMQEMADLEIEIDKARADGKVEVEKDLQARLDRLRDNSGKTSTELAEKTAKLQADISKAHTEGRAEDEAKLTTELADVQKTQGANTEKSGEKIISAYTDIASGAAAALGAAVVEGKNFGDAASQIAFDTLQSLVPIFVAQIFGGFIAANPLLGAVLAAAATGVLSGLVEAARPKKGAEGGAPEGITATYNKPKGATDTIPLWVAPREAIINARQSDEWRETLVAINSGGNVLRSVIGNASGAEFAALMREKFSPAEIAAMSGMPDFSEPQRIAEMPRPSISRMDAPTQNIVIMQDMTSEMRTVVKSVRAMHKDLSVQSRKPVEVVGGKIKTDGNNITATFERLRKRNVTRG